MWYITRRNEFFPNREKLLRLRESWVLFFKHVFSLLASIAFFIVIVVNARSRSSFTFSDTFANSISRFNPISANFN